MTDYPPRGRPQFPSRVLPPVCVIHSWFLGNTWQRKRDVQMAPTFLGDCSLVKARIQIPRRRQPSLHALKASVHLCTWGLSYLRNGSFVFIKSLIHLSDFQSDAQRLDFWIVNIQPQEPRFLIPAPLN